MRRILQLVLGVVFLSSGNAYAETYMYTGPYFTDVSGPYSNGMRITGTLVTSSPIPPDSDGLDISGILTSWSFSDGVQTISSDAAEFHPWTPYPEVFTDSQGNITGFYFHVFAAPRATMVGQSDSWILVFHDETSAYHEALVGAICVEVNDQVCVHAVGDGAASNPSESGSWVDSFMPPVPAMSTWSNVLLVLFSGLFGLAWVRRRL